MINGIHDLPLLRKINSEREIQKPSIRDKRPCNSLSKRILSKKENPHSNKTTKIESGLAGLEEKKTARRN